MPQNAADSAVPVCKIHRRFRNSMGCLPQALPGPTDSFRRPHTDDSQKISDFLYRISLLRSSEEKLTHSGPCHRQKNSRALQRSAKPRVSCAQRSSPILRAQINAGGVGIGTKGRARTGKPSRSPMWRSAVEVPGSGAKGGERGEENRAGGRARRGPA
ncbi:hypothetical protein B0H19DRAFT_1075852 [Mycena capillaripes]|nr:hypothetical protein B0H19DRAFT_1075852 [Mycena capillaripes]